MGYIGKMYGNAVPPQKTATTLANLDIAYPLQFITVTAATNFSLNGTMEPGQIITVIVRNNGSADITQTLPNSGKYVSLDGANIKIKNGGYVEISILCFKATNSGPCYIISSK